MSCVEAGWARKTSAVIELYAGLNRGTWLIASTCLGHVTTGLPFISIIQCLTPGLMCGLAWFRLASARRKGVISVKAVVLLLRPIAMNFKL